MSCISTFIAQSLFKNFAQMHTIFVTLKVNDPMNTQGVYQFVSVVKGSLLHINKEQSEPENRSLLAF